jgi:hypothetical protein
MAHPGVDRSGVLVDPRAYFHFVIGRNEGDPANDWVRVLKDLQRRGMHLNPKPGERADASWPFHGLSLMVSDNGNGDPRGRLWLPTSLATTDHQGNQWFTREVQVIADNPSGDGFIWQWRELGGHPYTPVAGASHDGQGGGAGEGESEGEAPPAQPPVLELDALIKRIDALEAQMKRTLQDGSIVAFKTDNGHFVCAEGGGGAQLNATREDVGGWEKFTLRKQ